MLKVHFWYMQTQNPRHSYRDTCSSSRPHPHRHRSLLQTRYTAASQWCFSDGIIKSKIMQLLKRAASAAEETFDFCQDPELTCGFQWKTKCQMIGKHEKRHYCAMVRTKRFGSRHDWHGEIWGVHCLVRVHWVMLCLVWLGLGCAAFSKKTFGLRCI